MAELLPPRKAIVVIIIIFYIIIIFIIIIIIIVNFSAVIIMMIIILRVRATANAIIICVGFILGFIMSKTFVDLIGAVNASGTFWLYGGVCVLGTVYTVVWVPETRGKTIQQIQMLFDTGSKPQVRQI